MSTKEGNNQLVPRIPFCPFGPYPAGREVFFYTEFDEFRDNGMSENNLLYKRQKLGIVQYIQYRGGHRYTLL
jgi:hypothetical protein